MKNKSIEGIGRFSLLHDFSERSYFNADSKDTKYLINPLNALDIDKSKYADDNWCMYGNYFEAI